MGIREKLDPKSLRTDFFNLRVGHIDCNVENTAGYVWVPSERRSLGSGQISPNILIGGREPTDMEASRSFS